MQSVFLIFIWYSVFIKINLTELTETSENVYLFGQITNSAGGGESKLFP